MKDKYKKILSFVLVPVILGGVVGALTVPGSDIKSVIPSWVFPAVWTILYVLMGYSAYRVNEKEGYVPRVYVIQLIVNLLWSFIFFKFKWFTFAFIWLIFLFILVIKMIFQFRSIDKTAGNLQIPYAAWLVVAAVLNIMQII